MHFIHHRSPHLHVRRYLFIVGLGILAWATLVGIKLRAAADDSFQVVVKCGALRGQTGAKLRVLQATPMGVNVLRRLADATFDRDGECRVELAAGEYGFEVGFIDGNKIFALRSPERRIARGAVVELRAEPQRPLTFPGYESQPMHITECAVRSAASVGEINWTSKSENDIPLLIMSPGQEYRVRIQGDGGDDLRFAMWQTISSTKSIVPLQDEQVCRCKFKIRTDGPTLQNPKVRFQFPDGEMSFAATDKTVFLTNRRFLSFAYSVDLTNGRRIAIRPWLGLAKKRQEFVLGGPFTAEAWAKVMVRKPVGGPETKHLVWDANLYDGGGQMVLEDKSQINFQQDIRSVSGAEVPRGRALTKADIASFVDRDDALFVDVTYQLDSPVSLKLRPKRFEAYGNRRFYTHAPPHWELQALNYLSRAERVYHMIEDLENKPSKHRVEVQWHAMNGTAWGCGPADTKAHIIMPFSGLKGSFNYYETPWALAHEMLHTFGYGHGDKMSRMTSLVETRFDQFRWFMADHPMLDPETAFDAFRLATHIDRANSPPAPDKTMNKQKKKR